jgi:GNAT superfamily N-acetyltransferase
MSARCGMYFKVAANTDGHAVRELVFGVLEEYGLAADAACTDRDLFDIEGSYAARGGCFELLVDEEGRLAGCYGLWPVDSALCELRKMYLRRDLRGRGLGKAILGRALERANSLGFRRVQLETASVLKEAISLYRSFGFRPFEPAHLSARCNCAMVLDLARTASP